MHCHCDYVCDVGGEVCIGLVFTMVAGNIMDQGGKVIIVIFVLVAMAAYSHGGCGCGGDDDDDDADDLYGYCLWWWQ